MTHLLHPCRHWLENLLHLINVYFRRTKNAIACMALLLLFNGARATSYPVNSYVNAYCRPYRCN